MRIRFQGPWGFHDEAWKNQLRDVPTVYRLRATDPDTGAIKPIPRASGVSDHEGVLDIGTTAHGYGRILTLLRACRSGRGSHAAGLKYHVYDYADAFPLATLRVEAIEVASEELAEAIELALIETYLYEFKDLPPLNSTAGNWRKVARWLKSQGRRPRKPDSEIDLDGLIPAALLFDEDE